MLPVEVLGVIFGYLPPKDFLQVQLICKSWNNVASLCIESWRSCCEALGMSTHNRFFLLSFGPECSWRDAYHNCKKQIIQFNSYQDFSVVNLTCSFAERPEELKFVAPHQFISNHDVQVECWHIPCFRPFGHPGINKIWSVQKDEHERLIAVNDTYVYLLTLTKPSKLSMRVLSILSGETLSTHITLFPTSHESLPLEFLTYRGEYTIKKCKCCECFVMCSHFLDASSHSTIMYLVYLCEGMIHCMPHKLTLPSNKENFDSCVIDKMDIISHSCHCVMGICEQHMLLVQCSYSISKLFFQNDGAPKLFLPIVDMPMRTELIFPEIDLPPKDPVPCYCMSHCSKYWSVCDANSTIYIYDLSAMSLVKAVKTDISTDFIMQVVQFSLLYALVCCCSSSHPNSTVCYNLIYVGPGPDCGKTVRKAVIEDICNFPRIAIFGQLEKMECPMQEPSMTYFPDNSLIFHLPSWCL